MQEKLRTEGIPWGKKTFQLIVLRKLTKGKNRKEKNHWRVSLSPSPDLPSPGSNLHFLYLRQRRADSLHCGTWEIQSYLAAAAAKSLQSCLTLCDPIDGSPLGSPVPGILQARTLEWVAKLSYTHLKNCQVILHTPKKTVPIKLWYNFSCRLHYNVKKSKLSYWWDFHLFCTPPKIYFLPVFQMHII